MNIAETLIMTLPAMGMDLGDKISKNNFSFLGGIFFSTILGVEMATFLLVATLIKINS